MILLEASDLHWIQGTEDERADQCAHGRVRFEIDDLPFVRRDDGEWTVNGAALFLLRTIEHDHCPAHSVADSNFVFPCCGQSCWFIGQGEFKLMCMGCNRGIDIEVKHIGGLVEIGRTDGKRKTIQLPEWRAAVWGFADQVRAFYDRSTPKTVPDDPSDKHGWEEFWKEWDRRRSAS